MKKLHIIVFTFTLCSIAFGQTDKLFEMNEIFVKDSSQFKTESDFRKRDSAFFEDDNYIVRKTCSGEWGGTIWFKNKLTGIEYSCEATCPVVVNKVNGTYVVTSTLAHMVGFSTVIEIVNPDSMAIFQLPEPRQIKRKMKIYYISDRESSSKKGTKILVDSVGAMVIASFPHNDQLFHIVTDFQKTYISKIENNTFVTVDTLSNSSLWTYDPELIRTDDGHSIVFFSNQEAKGYLDIYGNKMNLIRYQ